jgi:hypothetical protein
MRSLCPLVLTFVCIGVHRLPAEGIIQRLPEDGTWVRYTLKTTQTFPGEKEPMVSEGTITIASVGKEDVNGEACRWVEIVIESRLKAPKGSKETAKALFKALIAEQYLKKGADPRGHWVRGWAKIGNQKLQALTPELLALPQLKLNLLTAPWQETKSLKKKAIKTNLGELQCEGLSGQLVLKDGTIDKIDRKVTKRNAIIRFQGYFHEKAPFGVAWLEVSLEPEPRTEKDASARDVLSLQEVGTGAKSALPDAK